MNLRNLKSFKNDEVKPKFEAQNYFNTERDEYQSCSTHQDLQLLFRPYCHLTKFEALKYEIF